MSDTINKTWFRNRLRNGQLLVKCTMKLSGDYVYDAATNFSNEKEFHPAAPNMFDNWYIKSSYVYGDKEGDMALSFASCECAIPSD